MLNFQFTVGFVKIQNSQSGFENLTRFILTFVLLKQVLDLFEICLWINLDRKMTRSPVMMNTAILSRHYLLLSWRRKVPSLSPAELTNFTITWINIQTCLQGKFAKIFLIQKFDVKAWVIRQQMPVNKEAEDY